MLSRIKAVTAIVSSTGFCNLQNLQANSLLFGFFPRQSSYEDLADALRRYGPALVPAFMAHADFMNMSVHHHHGLPDKEHPIDTHSMVLVGVRIDETGKLYYLLHNWWRGKQFVEVSREYLLASKKGLDD
jgi:hypothetical protein